MFRLVGLCCVATLALADQFDPLELSHANTIIDARDGTVAKWTFKPSVSVLSVSESSHATFEVLLQRVSRVAFREQIDLTFDVAELENLSEEFFSQTKILLKKGGGKTYSVLSSASTVLSNPVEASIQVFILPRSVASHLIVLSQYGQSDLRISRQFALGSTPCFYHTLSRDGEIQFAFIFISSDLQEEEAAECLYEEYMQSLGLFSDHPNTPFFSFDDRFGGLREQRDSVLLESLYHPFIEPGDEVEKVLNLYERARSR